MQSELENLAEAYVGVYYRVQASFVVSTRGYMGCAVDAGTSFKIIGIKTSPLHTLYFCIKTDHMVDAMYLRAEDIKNYCTEIPKLLGMVEVGE